jgi:hypothetical protein
MIPVKRADYIGDAFERQACAFSLRVHLLAQSSNVVFEQNRDVVF